MLFGKLLEVANEPDENDLQDMELELRQGIDRAKGIAAACKMNTEEEHAFVTNSAGVI
jgi:hypothetical protein